MPFSYNVTLQDDTGSVTQARYIVRWDPEKVPSDDVAKACAAERTVRSGKRQDGSYKKMFAGISAELDPRETPQWAR